MKDIHGQAPSPPIRRPKLAGSESTVDATEASEVAVTTEKLVSTEQPASTEQPEAPAEKAPEPRIDLDLNPSEPAAALQFDQNIQLSP